MATNVQAGAETYGRVFAIMYDVSGQNESTLVSTLTNDWAYLVNTMHITDSPRYIRHKGKPVVTIWGFGFNTRSNTVADAQTVISLFKAAGCTVMGGVPTYWRTLGNDSQTNAAWADVYRSFDMISPWSVTRFSSHQRAPTASRPAPDHPRPERLHACTALTTCRWSVPGFSWTNVNGGTLQPDPALGGAFYWRQVYNCGHRRLHDALRRDVRRVERRHLHVQDGALPRPSLPVRSAARSAEHRRRTTCPAIGTSAWLTRPPRCCRGEIPVLPQMPITP